MTAPHYKPLRALRLISAERALFTATMLQFPGAALAEYRARLGALCYRETRRTGCFMHYGGTRWHACSGPSQIKGACDHE